ncbi:DUF3099 domain-containing protein [Streptomyces sp. NBC_01476]|uniref:DUF3099 domain-containing protein n=1 Tax=Streptomyces sp. NBC_01476 TaxID=2903881 RepID=UPI003FCDE8F4
MAKKGGPGVYQISGARTGLTEDVRGRQRRYVISMSIRTLSVILTVVLWNVERPLAWGTLVLGVLLPYVAVVFANAGRENTPIAPRTAYIPQPVRPALEATKVESSADRGTDPFAAQDGTPGSASGGASEGASGGATGAGRTTEPGTRRAAEPAAESGAESGAESATEAAEGPDAV